ncbi:MULTISPECIES: HNH endonuclease [Enterobacteriaceae]
MCDYRRNGLLFRRDMHELFDENMIAFSGDTDYSLPR